MTWRTKAACVGYPTQWWFTDNPVELGQARALCLSCPVAAECRQAGRGEYGLWGYTAPKRVEVRHGTANGYSHHRCRCGDCCDAWRDYKTERQARAIAASTHGIRSTYVTGCRCDPCRAAESAYKAARRERARQERPADPDVADLVLRLLEAIKEAA
jgi:hypothetical protein